MKRNLIIAGVIIVLVCIALFMYASRTITTISTSRTFNAPVDEMWLVMNDAESMKRWWGPKGYHSPLVLSDFREGGTFTLGMSADGTDQVVYNSGTYTQIIPNQKVATTMSFSDKDGKAVPASTYGVPGNWPDETTVTIDFKSTGGQTEITITETGIPMIMSAFAKMGWDQQFDKIEKMVQK